MMQNAIYILLAAYVLMGMTACADIRGLSGGKTDTQGPRIDSTRYSTPNRLTNFKEKEIILTFDEWIKLEQAQNKIIISPPLNEKPIIKLKHKSVVIRFQEELRPNTTYTINLADAVKDYTEGNVVDNFNYVFSTGEELDSLKVEGSIVDAISGEAKKGVWVMLYNNLADSIPALERPYYMTKTKDDGTFTIDNIKADTYKIFALVDKNSNYKYDMAGEEIAYWKDSFVIAPEVKQKIQLRMFTPEQPLKLMSQRFANKGTIRFMFNTPIEHKDSVEIKPITEIPNFQYKTLVEGDSVYMWFLGDMQADSVYQFLVQGKDTVALTWSSTLGKIPSPKLISKLVSQSSGKGGKSADREPLNKNEKEALALYFNVPISVLDSSLVHIYKDSISERTLIAPAQFTFDSLHVQKLYLNNTLETGTYILAFLPNALENYLKERNSDTLKQSFKVLKGTDYGRLEVVIQPTDSLIGQNFVMELYKGKEDLVAKRTFQVENTNPLTFPFQELVPSSYMVRLIYDNNKNGKWDTGSYWLKTEPEKIFNSSPTQVRADWDNELTIDLKPKTKAMKK